MSTSSFLIFNVNDYVQVRLTDYGRECLREIKQTLPKEDKDGWSRWQAWELMQDLGQYLSNGMNLPFETTVRVEVERPINQFPVQKDSPRESTNPALVPGAYNSGIQPASVSVLLAGESPIIRLPEVHKTVNPTCDGKTVPRAAGGGNFQETI